MRYMFGEIQYGGRVTDDLDKILLNTYCKAWFGEHMFTDKFSFYKGKSRDEVPIMTLYRAAWRSGSVSCFYDDHDRKVDGSIPPQTSLLRPWIRCFTINISANLRNQK